MNNVILIGRLTADVVIKKTQNNKSVISFTIAVSNGKDRPSDFINCVAWEKTAELISQYVKKGHMLGIVGKVSTRSYDNSDGKKQYVTEILVREIEFLESKPKAQEQTYKNPYADFNEEVKDEQKKYLDISDDDVPF